jgi:transcriptional regulator with XRE-family HTH domain
MGLKQMPRKNPLTGREIQICHRLREWRRRLDLPQSYVAEFLGVESAYLASIEHARAPLQYRFAHVLLTVGQTNAHWLATGDGKMVGSIPVPNPASIANKKALFSTIYDTLIATSGPPQYSFPSGIRGREMARVYIGGILTEWLATVDDADLDKFVSDLRQSGNLLVAGLSHSDSRTIKETREALHRLGIFALAQQKAIAVLNTQDKTSLLDTVNQGFTVHRVSWDYLKQQVNQKTVSFGAKAQLARDMNVSRQVLNAWLKGTAQPSAEQTLYLLKWVWPEEITRLLKSPGSADNTRRARDPKKKVKNANSKSSPKTK